MDLYLCLHNTYQSVGVAIASDNKKITQTYLPKEIASAQLIPTINNLLQSHTHQLRELSCIIVNQGPAPFTTLRTMISTVNGIAFATDIPLIGIDALQAFAREYSDDTQMPTVALLNAFNKSVYYAIQYDSQQLPDTGCANIEQLIEQLKKAFCQ